MTTTDDYDGDKFLTTVDGKRAVTPMLLALIAIGFTDLLFALDSIPAIYGLTEEPHIVFTANAFALMGLRQLYFLIGGLLDRLVYLSHGLSLILAFIGVKLVLHALHENTLPFINGGEGEGAGDLDRSVAQRDRGDPGGHHRRQPGSDAGTGGLSANRRISWCPRGDLNPINGSSQGLERSSSCENITAGN